VKKEKNDSKRSKVGRPPKGIFARAQIAIWAIAVYRRAGAKNFGELQDLLGDDGKWEGMWSRYWRGLTAPSGKRIGRIEEKVPGSARYFQAGFWDLLEDRPYLWQDFFDAIATLPPELFPHLRRESTFGRLTNSSESEALLKRAVDLVSDASDGIYGLTVILVLLREAELVRDESLYLRALKAWANASEESHTHPILVQFAESLFVLVAQPVERIVFADQAKNDCWQQYLAAYIDYWHQGNKPRPDEFDVLDCIRRFADFQVRSTEELKRLVSAKRFDNQTNDIAYPSWVLPARIRR